MHFQNNCSFSFWIELFLQLCAEVSTSEVLLLALAGTSIRFHFSGKTLEEQGVTHNVKVMVLELKLSEEETRRKIREEEIQYEQEALKKKEINQRMQRTKRGLEILAERGKGTFSLSPRLLRVGYTERDILFFLQIFQHLSCHFFSFKFLTFPF